MQTFQRVGWFVLGYLANGQAVKDHCILAGPLIPIGIFVSDDLILR